MEKYRYYVYLDKELMLDYFNTHEEAITFIENFNFRYPDIPCYIKLVRSD